MMQNFKMNFVCILLIQGFTLILGAPKLSIKKMPSDIAMRGKVFYFVCTVTYAAGIDTKICFKTNGSESASNWCATQKGGSCTPYNNYDLKINCHGSTHNIRADTKIYKMTIKYFAPKYKGEWWCQLGEGNMSAKAQSAHLTVDMTDVCTRECQNGAWLNKRICRCDCLHAWSGHTCDKCEKPKCQHGATFNKDQCRCLCHGFWAGSHCQHCKLACAAGMVNKKDCTCKCPSTWTGVTCEVCNLKCKNQGLLYKPTCTCNCREMWGGDSCNKCALKCKNKGKILPTSCRCYCPHIWEGTFCERCVIGCLNQGKVNESACFCKCPPAFTGYKCEKKKKPGLALHEEVDDDDDDDDDDVADELYARRSNTKEHKNPYVLTAAVAIGIVGIGIIIAMAVYYRLKVSQTAVKIKTSITHPPNDDNSVGLINPLNMPQT